MNVTIHGDEEMTKLEELRAAAMVGPSIADYDHVALARYVTALNPVTVLALLDVAEAASAHLKSTNQHPHSQEWIALSEALAKLR